MNGCRIRLPTSGRHLSLHDILDLRRKSSQVRLVTALGARVCRYKYDTTNSGAETTVLYGCESRSIDIFDSFDGIRRKPTPRRVEVVNAG